MNLIHETNASVRYHTNIRWVLEAMNVSALDYDWYLSDLYMCIAMGGDVLPHDFCEKDQWMTGHHLHQLVTAQQLLFTWGVFSAVPKGFRCVVKDPPYADGNPSFWLEKECNVQLERALFEIVCWDGVTTLLIGIDETSASNYLSRHPDAKELLAYNLSSNQKGSC